MPKHMNYRYIQLNIFSEKERDRISLDLFQAYFDTEKNKRNTIKRQ